MKLSRAIGLGGLMLMAAFGGCQQMNQTPASQTPAVSEPPPLRLGLQAWTFRRYTFAETLEKAQALGIHYIQAFPKQILGGGMDGQFNHYMDEATRAKVLALAKSRDITILSYGVVTGADEAEWRQIFTFAKAMGLQSIASEPPQDVLPLVDRLSKESGVDVALHNHPPPNRYWKLETSLAAIAPYGANIGLCADTGHWVRSGYDPVESLRRAAGRILAVHFKDLNEAGVKKAHDVPWGTGVSNAAGQLAELRRQHYPGVVFIEYEYDTPSLYDEVSRSVQYFNRAMAAPVADLVAGRVVPPGFSAGIDDVWAGSRGRDSLRWPMPQPVFAPDLANGEYASGTWAWDGDLLVAKGAGDIWTREKYTDFAYSLEFRCAAKAVGAVLLRRANIAEWSAYPLQVAIRQEASSDDKTWVGAVEGWRAPTRRIAIAPGEWHRLVIIAKDGRLNVILDGEQVVKMNLDDWKEPRENPDGSANAFDRPGRYLAREGNIGLRSEGGSVTFRNIRVERF